MPLADTRVVPLPPIDPAYLQYAPFHWCQIRYVFARELTRSREPVDWLPAYQEASEVASALEASGQPLAIGARPGEVVWPLLICAANQYAHMPPADRARVREGLAAGQPVWAVLVATVWQDPNSVITEPHLCDRAAVEDPEYRPEPPCVPTEASLGVGAFFASGLWFLGVLAIMKTFANGRGPGQARRRRERS